MADASPDPITPTPCDRPSGCAVLVVEDDADLGFMLGLALQQAGGKVTVVDSAEEAWRLLEADPSRYSLLLTDHDLPGESGASLALRVRKAIPRLPIIMMTGYTLEAEQVLGATTVDCMIPKPFGIRALTERIDSLVGR